MVKPKEEEKVVKSAEKPQVVVKITEEDLDKAAMTLTEALPDYVKREIRSYASEDLGEPLWKYVCGLLFACYNGGMLGNFDFDPVWEEGDDFLVRERSCVQCGGMFIPKQLGQKLCSDKCGIAYATKAFKEAQKKREEQKKK